MREVSQTEAIETLPALIRESQCQSIRIKSEDGQTAVIISEGEYQHVRNAAFARMKAIAEEASPRFEAHAKELGISPEELLEHLLKR